MELAMESVKDKFDFLVSWEPFFLKPDTPPEGLPKPAAYRDPSNPRLTHLQKMGSDVGLDFANKAPKFPSTLKSHALLEYAKEQNDGIHQNTVAEKLFKKYFTDGDMLGEDTLLEIAGEVGFNTDEVKSHVNDESVLSNIHKKAREWSLKGISGVPTFYFNGQKVFSGAQDVQTFARMFEIVNEKFPLTTDSKS